MRLLRQGLEKPTGSSSTPDTLCAACGPAHTGAYWLDAAPGSLIPDSGCRRSLAGADWHRNFQQELEKFGLKGERIDLQERFTFGNASEEVSNCSWNYPVSVMGRTGVMAIAEVGTATPPLMSRATMAQLGIRIDFGKDEIECGDVNRRAQYTDTGHMLIDATEWRDDATTNIPEQFRLNKNLGPIRRGWGPQPRPEKQGVRD